MKLVDGEYCTKVKQKCLRSWFDKGRWAKTVCEQFAKPTRCMGKRIPKRYCIDTYEWPNIPGQRPEVMNSYYQAQIKCAAVGKRLCTETEWTLACEGPQMKPFPHGYVRDGRKCNGDHRWVEPSRPKIALRDPVEVGRLWRGVRSGSQPGCVSDYGVADLTGNPDEFVTAELPGAKWESVLSGGHWYYGVRNQCRPKTYAHDPKFFYYFVGHRCCAEADGKATDPVTSLQRRLGLKISFAESHAKCTIKQLRHKLELKKRGACDCPPHDTSCRVMCGLILGSNAVDGTEATRVPKGHSR